MDFLEGRCQDDVQRKRADGWDFPGAIAGARELMADWIAKLVRKKADVQPIKGEKTLTNWQSR
jgi:hypothetical protein